MIIDFNIFILVFSLELIIVGIILVFLGVTGIKKEIDIF